MVKRPLLSRRGGSACRARVRWQTLRPKARIVDAAQSEPVACVVFFVVVFSSYVPAGLTRRGTRYRRSTRSRGGLEEEVMTWVVAI